MKTKLLLLLLLFTSGINLFAQSTPTTLEEYNYVTKGYRVQIESGLDMKKGYQFAPILTEEIGNYTFSLSSLLRIDKNQVAAILVRTKSNVSGTTYYHCIPHGNSDLISRYYNDIKNWDESILEAYSLLISVNYADIFKKFVDLQIVATKK